MAITDYYIASSEPVELEAKAPVARQIEFGTGDICLSPGLLQGEDIIGSLCFTEQEPRPIGEIIPYENDRQMELKQVPVRMIFTKVESIDSVINSLLDVRRFMTNGTVRPISSEEIE